MSRIKTHVKPDDLVEVIAGNHKGKQGKVLEVHPERERRVTCRQQLVPDLYLLI